MSALVRDIASPLVIPGNSGRAEIRLFVDKDTMPQDESVERLQALSVVKGIFGHIVALPEVHYKSGFVCPTGTVIASRDYVMPGLIPIANNCGMRVFLTPLTSADMNEKAMDQLFGILRSKIFHGPNGTFKLKKQEAGEILSGGCEWGVKRFGLDKNELLNIECRGNMFTGFNLSRKQILRNIPRASFKVAEMGLDYMGGGNHFIEMQEVSEVFDEQRAGQLKIKKGQIVFMMHSDAGPVGGIIGQYFSAFKMSGRYFDRLISVLVKSSYHLKRLRSLQEAASLPGTVFRRDPPPLIDVNSPLGIRYISASYAAANFGYLKRMYLTEIVRRALREVFSDKEMACPLLYDLSHVLIQREDHDGQKIWVHRQGGCQAYPKEKMGWHPVYKHTGQPFPLPSSLATPSYICVAESGAKEALYSSCHGTGNVTHAFKNDIREEELLARLRINRIKVYHMRKTSIVKHNPGKYKDAERVLNALKAFNIASPVCKVKPLASLKE